MARMRAVADSSANPKSMMVGPADPTSTFAARSARCAIWRPCSSQHLAPYRVEQAVVDRGIVELVESGTGDEAEGEHHRTVGECREQLHGWTRDLALPREQQHQGLVFDVQLE